MRTVTAKAPGKLFLAGEFAITTPGQAALVVAVDRFITVTLTARDDQHLTLASTPFGQYQTDWEQLAQGVPTDTPWHLALQTLATFAEWSDHPLPGLDLTVTSTLNEGTRKLGLGSSGALVVALIDALAQLMTISLTPLTRFKLSVLATSLSPTFKAGSMGDLAAASYHGVVCYQRFDPVWLRQQLDADGRSLQRLVATDWPQLALTPLTWPADWQLVVGWTQQPADTQVVLKRKPHVDAYVQLSTVSLQLVEQAQQALLNADLPAFHQALQANQTALLAYAEARHDQAYATPALQTLLGLADEEGYPAKISGAGGGDNGFTIMPKKLDPTMLKQKWEAAGIIPLDLTLYF